MTKQEWMDIGFEKGIIDLDDYEQITFEQAYLEWFKMKMTFVKGQTLDRIEVTYNRYYSGTGMVGCNISKISDEDLITFLLRCCLSQSMTYRELGRIMQILKGVLVYMRDINKGGAPLHDWEKIKRNLPLEKLESGFKTEYAISQRDVEKLIAWMMILQ